MNKQPGLVIIGLGVAGLAAAQAFREHNQEQGITIISDESVHTYSRPRLPEIVAGKVEPEKISLHTDQWYGEQAIQLQLNQTATAIDPDHKRILMSNHRWIEYDKLILATGANGRCPAVAGLPAPKIYGLRNLQDAVTLKQAAAFKQHALLIGGGLLGLEIGYALTRLGLKVIVIEIEPRLLPRQLDDESAALLQQQLMTLGFEFFVGAKVDKIISTSSQVHLVLSSGIELTGDLGIISAGIAPRVELAQACGLAVGLKGIMVDDQMKTSHSDIFAAGDCVQWRGINNGLWMSAQAMGRMAGLNAAGMQGAYTGVIPSTKLKVAGIDVASQGNISPDGADVLARRYDGDRRLIKLYLRQGHLAGVIQVGSTAGALQYKKLIEKKCQIKGCAQLLLEPEADFKAIPGFV